MIHRFGLPVAAALVAASFACAQTPAGKKVPADPPAAKATADKPAADRPVPNVPNPNKAPAPGQVKFDEVALTDALDFFRDLTGANLVVDWKALQDAGVSKDTPVSLQLRGVKIGVALQKTLEAAAPGLLTFYVDENIIHVTTHTEADNHMVTRIYDVNDLLVEIPDYADVPQFSLSQSNGSRSGQSSGSGSSSSSSSSSGSTLGGSTGGSSSSTSTKTKTRSEKADELIDLITTTIRPEVWQQNGGKAGIKFAAGRLVVTAPLDVQEAIGGK